VLWLELVGVAERQWGVVSRAQPSHRRGALGPSASLELVRKAGPPDRAA